MITTKDKVLLKRLDGINILNFVPRHKKPVPTQGTYESYKPNMTNHDTKLVRNNLGQIITVNQGEIT